MQVIASTTLWLALLLCGNAVLARSGHHGSHHHHGQSYSGAHRGSWPGMPATSPAAGYCTSTGKRVLDARDCPEPLKPVPLESPVVSNARENR